MSYVHLNLNPYGQDTGDCVIRAITLALNLNWFMVHDELSFLSRKMADMPSSNRVWKAYLSEKGYQNSQVLIILLLTSFMFLQIQKRTFLR